jgi:hypothetical protein
MSDIKQLLENLLDGFDDTFSYTDDLYLTIKEYLKDSDKIEKDIIQKYKDSVMIQGKILDENDYAGAWNWMADCLEKAEKLKQEADELFKKLSKFELLATLTK